MSDSFMSIPVSEFEALAEKARRGESHAKLAEAALGDCEVALVEARRELIEIDGLLADPSGSPLDAINLARKRIAGVLGT